MDTRIHYRKAFGVSAPPVWHFNPYCPDYPASGYVERSDPPPAEDVCRKCAAPEQERAHSARAKTVYK